MVAIRKYHEDKIGCRFGRLVFLGMTEKKTSDDERYLGEFSCDCGQFALVVPRLVFKGETSSCGCFRRELGREKHMIKKRQIGLRKGSSRLNKSSSTKHRYIHKRNDSAKYHLKIVVDGQTYCSSFDSIEEALSGRQRLCHYLQIDVPVH